MLPSIDGTIKAIPKKPIRRYITGELDYLGPIQSG